MKIMNYIKLMRPFQWYKNLLIFLPLFFANRIFDLHGIFLTFIGFLSLCIISSTSYIINDIVDRKKDRINPEKKDRPITSRRISVINALIISLFMFMLAVGIASYLNIKFLYCVLALFGFTQLYTFWLKKEAIVDIIIISINFVIRAISGAYVIDVKISQWLIIGVFFLSVFLAIGKRASEINALKGVAWKHRYVLKFYTKDATNAMLIISTTLLLISYILFSLFSEHKFLYFSIPVVVYPLFRFFYLIESGSQIPRHLELMWKDKRLLISIFLSILTIFLLIYREILFP